MNIPVLVKNKTVSPFPPTVIPIPMTCPIICFIPLQLMTVTVLATRSILKMLDCTSFLVPSEILIPQNSRSFYYW